MPAMQPGASSDSLRGRRARGRRASLLCGARVPAGSWDASSRRPLPVASTKPRPTPIGMPGDSAKMRCSCLDAARLGLLSYRMSSMMPPSMSVTPEALTRRLNLPRSRSAVVVIGSSGSVPSMSTSSTGSLIVHEKSRVLPAEQLVASNTDGSKRSSIWKPTRRLLAAGSRALTRTSTSSVAPFCWNCKPERWPRSTSSSPARRLAYTRFVEGATAEPGQATDALSSTASQWLSSSVKPPYGSHGSPAFTAEG